MGREVMLVVLPTTCLLVLLVVGVHFEALALLTALLRNRKPGVRRWVAVSILCLLMTHILEVSIFAIGLYAVARTGQYGELTGATTDSLTDYWYYSFVAYTSLGFGDITPTDSLRLMTAVETLSGLILIAWSASFIFMQMHRFWIEQPPDW